MEDKNSHFKEDLNVEGKQSSCPDVSKFRLKLRWRAKHVHGVTLTQNSTRSETMSENTSEKTKGDWFGLSHGADKGKNAERHFSLLISQWSSLNRNELVSMTPIQTVR